MADIPRQRRSYATAAFVALPPPQAAPVRGGRPRHTNMRLSGY